MIKKVIATAAIAASVMGASAAAAPQAMAADDSGPSSANGNGALQSYGNSSTYGHMSPQMALIQGSFNKPCIAVNDLPIGVGALIGVSVQDIPILSDHQQQQCVENSTNAKRDGALAHLLKNVSILSANGD